MESGVYDPELFRREIPRLGTVPLTEIMQAAGRSKASASDFPTHVHAFQGTSAPPKPGWLALGRSGWLASSCSLLWLTCLLRRLEGLCCARATLVFLGPPTFVFSKLLACGSDTKQDKRWSSPI